MYYSAFFLFTSGKNGERFFFFFSTGNLRTSEGTDTTVERMYASRAVNHCGSTQMGKRKQSSQLVNFQKWERKVFGAREAVSFRWTVIGLLPVRHFFFFFFSRVRLFLKIRHQ